MNETARITAGIRMVYAGISCASGRSGMTGFICITAAYALIRIAGNKVINMPASSGTMRCFGELLLSIVNGAHRAGMMHVHNSAASAHAKFLHMRKTITAHNNPYPSTIVYFAAILDFAL